MAAVAERLPDLVGARGRRRTGLRGLDRTVPRQRAGRVRALQAVNVETRRDGRPDASHRVPGTEFELEADLVLLAMGFLGPERGSLLSQLGREADRSRQRLARRFVDDVEPGVFTAGDMQRGQSLIVWAIADGRNAARSVDTFFERAKPRDRGGAATARSRSTLLSDDKKYRHKFVSFCCARLHAVSPFATIRPGTGGKPWTSTG